MAKKYNTVYGFDVPLVEVPHVAKSISHAPTVNDKDYALGDVVIYKPTADSGTSYVFCGTDSSGQAIWALQSPSPTEIEEIECDNGDNITATSGVIILAGGTNLSTTASDSPATVTIDLDDAIFVATSVTSPLYTADSADAVIKAGGANDVIAIIGDNAGATSFKIQDIDEADVFKIDSNGDIDAKKASFVGDFAQTGGTFEVGQDNAADAIKIGGGTSARQIDIGNSAAAHTINIGSAAAGAIAIDTASSTSIDSATASNFTVTGASEDLTLSSVGGSVKVSATEAVADSVLIESTAGGIDVTAATNDVDITATLASINLTANEAVADAIVLNSVAGGVDINGVLDIDVTSTGGSVNLTATESAVDAIVLNASAGGIDVTAATNDIDITATLASVKLTANEAVGDAIVLNSVAGGIDVNGVLDIDVTSTGGSVNIKATETASDAIVLDASTGAGGMQIKVGTGKLDITGTVKTITADLIGTSGICIPKINQNAMVNSALNTGVAATGATGDVNNVYLQTGVNLNAFVIGAGQTILQPVMTANGLEIGGDQAASEGYEYNLPYQKYTIGTDAAFFFELGLYVNDMDGAAPFVFGFRKEEANNGTFTAYTDYASIGLNAVTSAVNIATLTNINSVGQVATDSTEAWGGDGTTKTLRVDVSAAGVVTYAIDGTTYAGAGFTFDNGDVVIPFIRIEQSATPTDVAITSMKIGYQA